MRADLAVAPQRGSGLVDVLDRVLDKGLVIAGDIKVSLAEVELLTIRVRLLVCSIDKAQEIGLDWWKYDHNLAPGRQREQLDVAALQKRIEELEGQLTALRGPSLKSSTKSSTSQRRRLSRSRKTDR
jgi:hypothetical protein